jgi:glycosyltransferase involved in cell wall biosynthesis
VVRNTPDLEELPPAGAPGPTPTAVYVGDLRPSRGLHAMIDAVAATDDWHLDLVGELREVDPDALASELERRDLTDRIRLHGRLPLAQAWERARGAWVGLCLLEDTPAYRAALPTKVYEYLAVGLPVLATPLPRIRALIEQEASAGVCVPTPADAATTLRSWSADPAVLAPLRTAASDWATHHLAAGSPFDTLAAAILTLRQDRDDP